MLIHKVCKNGDIYSLSRLLKGNCDVNAEDENGETGLIIACRFGNKEIISMLMKAKCNLNIQDSCGNTGLIWACYFGYKEIVSMLIQANCDLNIQDKYKITGLMEACKKGYKDIIIELVRYGCKIDELVRKKYPNKINRGLELRIQLFDTCIRYVLKNMDEFKNKIHLLPYDIRKYFVSKN